MTDPRQVPAWTSPYRLRVALRLLRARKINLISILGVTLGVGAIIVVMSVMDGFQFELRAMIRGTLSDLIVKVDPIEVSNAGGYAEIKQAVEAVPGVKAVTLQQHTFGAVPGEHRDIDGGRQNYVPVRVVGITPAHEREVSEVLDQMEAAPGHPDDPFEVNAELLGGFVPEETPRVVISAWMARRLGRGIPYGVGDRFTLITFEEIQEKDRPKFVMHDREVIVSRIYRSGNSEYDKLHLYVDLTGTGRVFFPSQEGLIAELRVRLDDYARADDLRDPVARAVSAFDPQVGAYPKWFVETWEERQSNLLKAVNNEKFLLAFVLFFIVLVACFTIFATLTMTVVEKTRDIGVLRALGATPGGILSIFMLNGTLVGGLGAALGYGTGLVVAHNVNPIRAFLHDWFGIEIFPSNIYLFDEIPTHIDHEAALSFAIGAAVSALFFAIIPAVRAARLKPVQALRFE